MPCPCGLNGWPRHPMSRRRLVPQWVRLVASPCWLPPTTLLATSGQILAEREMPRPPMATYTPVYYMGVFSLWCLQPPRQPDTIELRHEPYRALWSGSGHVQQRWSHLASVHFLEKIVFSLDETRWNKFKTLQLKHNVHIKHIWSNFC